MAAKKDKEEKTVQAETTPELEVKADAKEKAKADAEPKPDVKPEQPAQPDKLDRIEQLLVEQAGYNKKMLRSSRFRSFMVTAFVGVFVVMSIVLFNMMKDVPKLVTSANTLVTEATGDLADVMESVKGIDFDSMNSALQGIGSMDYEAMNSSIQALQKGAEAFQAFAEALSNPFGMFGN